MDRLDVRKGLPLDESDRQVLEAKLGFRFTDPALLRRALVHCSVSPTDGNHNETLEFLGDAVVGLVVSDLLFAAWPRADEGHLSRRRAALVNAQSLAALAVEMDLGSFLALGRGEEKTGGRTKTSILAGVFEAVIGAVYRDGGFDAASRVLAGVFGTEITRSLEEALDNSFTDFKTRLQERSQKDFQKPPAYTLLREEGPDHAKAFVSRVEVDDRILGTGQGASKKSAEQRAAREALQVLRREDGPGEEVS